MANQRMKNSWKLIQRRIRNAWDEEEFTDKEFKECRKDYPGMVELIQDKTGEPRAKVIRKMDAVMGVMYQRPYRPLTAS